jgi:hypothetical protein
MKTPGTVAGGDATVTVAVREVNAMLEPIKIGSSLIEVGRFDLSDPAAVEQMLLEVEQAQGSTGLDWLDGSPPEVRQAVTATVTRPAALIWEETEGEEPGSSALRASPGEIRSLGIVPAGKWVETTAKYRPGWFTYYWFKLRTHFWWDGGEVVQVPTQEISGDGSWGWAYEGAAAANVEGWPAPEAYRSSAQGKMNFGRGADWVRRPHIEHVVHGNGNAERTHHD